ncbi:MAG: hypothetical protein ACYSWS_01875 [Planctomycetota bacterium]|jgi:hypothetical protein
MIDLIGQKFGRLIVIRKMNNDLRGNHRWLCLCGCGIEKIIQGNNLNNGNTKSCGCLRIKHGNSKIGKISRTYKSWQQMIQRCTNINISRYKDYGGRGIKVCKRWTRFMNFIEDMGERPPGMSIDRIHNDSGYFKGNCRWATSKQNSRNRRNNRLITHNGKTQCLSAWAEETGINANTIVWRLNHNWLIEKALTITVNKKEIIYNE